MNAPDPGQEFRAALRRLRRSQTAFARLLKELGDPRPFDTVLRTVQELARPGRRAPIPWAVLVAIGAIERLDRAGDGGDSADAPPEAEEVAGIQEGPAAAEDRPEEEDSPCA